MSMIYCERTHLDITQASQKTQLPNPTSYVTFCIMKRSIFIALTAVIIPLSSCATSQPSLGEDGQVKIQRGSSSLNARGIQEFTKIKNKKKISSNRAYNAQLNRVGQRLVRHVNLPGAQWEFVVFEDATPNAFALPGGKIGVHTGLFPITKNDAGLAAVIGHEIAHVTSNHAGTRIQQQQGLALGGALLDSILRSQGGSDKSRATLGGLYGAGASIGYALPNSRKHEFEADKIGAIYMARAGYHPQEAINLWKRFAAYSKSKGRKTPEWMSTHPVDSNRIQSLQNFLPTALREYNRR